MSYLAAKFIHDLGKADPIPGRHIFYPQPLRIKADMRHYFFTEKRHAQGMKIPVRGVVAFAKIAADDKHPINSFGESAEYKRQIDSAGAHDAYQSHFSGILQSGNSSQVGSAVSSPLADKA